MGARRRVAKPLIWWAAWLAADVAAAMLRGVADTLHDWRTRTGGPDSPRRRKPRPAAKRRLPRSPP